MTFDQALELLKDAWIERCLLGGGARLNARVFDARRLTDLHPEFDRRRYDAALDDANRIVASHRRTLQALPSRFRTDLERGTGRDAASAVPPSVKAA
jgi:hypothetical protein